MWTSLVLVTDTHVRVRDLCGSLPRQATGLRLASPCRPLRARRPCTDPPLLSRWLQRCFQVNWLSQFLAFNRLLLLLRRTSKVSGTDVRVIALASEHHRFCPSSMHFGSLEETNNPDISPSQLYGRTKAANIIGCVRVDCSTTAGTAAS